MGKLMAQTFGGVGDDAVIDGSMEGILVDEADGSIETTSVGETDGSIDDSIVGSTDGCQLPR